MNLNTAFERTRVWSEIDLGALRGNFNLIQKSIGKTKIMAVVKSNAYGHGALPVAKALDGLAAGYGTATPDEAIELREGGISAPVMILGYTDPAWAETLVSRKIIPTVFSMNSAEAISRAATMHGAEADIMLALDTGMERIGFFPTDGAAEEIRRIYNLPGISVRGIFTHLACADSSDYSSAQKQLDVFDSFCRRLENDGVRIPMKSALNSAGTIVSREGYDLSRVGIVLFGYAPSGELAPLCRGLKPVMSIRARISRVAEVEAGQGISYGHTFVTDRKTRVATVCAGYADGVPRLLSGNGTVIIRGRRAPILGRVCMDQLMVDVSGIEGAAVGDIATIMGEDGGERITADEIAGYAGTVSYEVLCSFDRRRVPKIYLNE
ncbi:MAG: alanine racemase [Firmicutes bacterium]|nr:alanine racemase [Bacillota bacterium]